MILRSYQALARGPVQLLSRSRTREWKLWPKYFSSSQVNHSSSESDNYPGWRVMERRKVADFDISAVLLEHEQTRARYLHMGCQDSNKAFSVNLRTTPRDSTGVAHILEHTTLCGSHKFPVRDPFMKMLNRSLSTFMNAMTGPDYTLYPFSTCNEQDYYNLMSVYLDSVFKPLLREQDFLQEGWRLEHDEIDDVETPFVIKGVVFNEMKGAYANSQSLFGQKLLNNLYPSDTYSNSSGGFPLHIPQLTWEQLKQFHAEHYHPSNTRMLSYGDLDLAATLRFIHEHYLSKFSAISVDTSVPAEPRWSAPRREHVSCAPDPMNPDPARQATVAVSWLQADILDLNTSFALQVAAELLTGGPSAPLYKALIDSGLGTNFSPVTGYEDHTRDTNFTVGLQNIEAANTEAILAAIDDTIDKVIEEGFEAERVEAVLHSYELSLKHKSANFGVNLIMSLTPFWNHADTPLNYLEVNKTINWFKQQLADDPKYLQNLIRTYIKENKHKLVQTMAPVDNYNELEQEQFDTLEKKLREDLTEAEKAEIHSKCLELQKMQSDKEDVSCLPTVLVSDISDEYQPTVMEQTTLAATPVLVTTQPTNQVSYFRALLDTSGLAEDLKPYLPIFAMVLPRMGAGDLGYADLDTAVELRTGGLAAMCHVTTHPDTALAGHGESLLVSSHCLERNTEHMFQLWQSVFTSVHWDNTQRLAQLLKMSASQALNGVAHAGHKYAMTSAASCLTPAAARVEQFAGMSHIQLLSSVSQGDVTPLVAKLRQIAGQVLARQGMQVALHSSHTAPLLAATETFLSNIPDTSSAGSSAATSAAFSPSSVKQHYVTPFPINFTSQSVATVSYSHPDYAPLRVLAALLGSKFLHPEIREKGGAYGGGASASDGAFTFYSYRDPKNLETFSVYEKSADWALGDNFDQGDVNEAILRVFQSVDAPVTPGHRGMRHFLTGVSDQMFSEHRLRLKSVTVADVKRVAESYLVEPRTQGKTMIGGVHPGLEDHGWRVHKQ